MSHTGVPLSRPTTLRFTLDVNREQHQWLLAHAGASRLAFNHHLGRVKANLGQRTAERSYGIADEDLTPSLSWSRVEFINHINAWKDGRSPDSPVSVDEDGNKVLGLPWRHEVSTDVFETASVNAAQALGKWAASKEGAPAAKAGRRVGFPRFKSRHRTTPAFRLRAKYQEGAAAAVRPTGPKTMRFPKLGELRTRESTRQLRRMLERGRFHAFAASFRFERGRWVVSVTGVAAPLHHARRSQTGRHPARVGVDLGVKTLAVIADETGRVLDMVEGVKALKHAQVGLRLANKALARTKRDSVGRSKAARRLGRMHARVAAVRKALLHQLTGDLAKGYTCVVVEDLNVAGMLANRRLAQVVSDAAFGEVRRHLGYKTAWYGTELVIADRWFPSSKTCSGCGTVKADLTLSARVYHCDACGLVIDRDINAAVNLARYAPSPTTLPPPVAA
ncbi:IS607 family element RNA-guided endonuclease TnpB [Oryzihumus sp.]|uniref:IS607 family element RNA-guided endonuclease TnpB n=1 Tax=Oryzihumus sp. TaxID=1968903 RepID=UPI002ED9037C